MWRVPSITEDQRAHAERDGLEASRTRRSARRTTRRARPGRRARRRLRDGRSDRRARRPRPRVRPSRQAAGSPPPRYRARLGRRTGRSRRTSSTASATPPAAASPSPCSSRVSPAIARMIASKSPAARRARRVSTLPRSATTSRSGRRRSASKRRRTDDVPRRAPRVSAAIEAAARASSASRGSARSGTAAIRKPEASWAGRSFIECTATSIWPSASACSSSLTKSPLPPTCASAAVAIRSPLVRMGRSRCSRTERAPRACAVPTRPVRAREGWAANRFEVRKPSVYMVDIR